MTWGALARRGAFNESRALTERAAFRVGDVVICNVRNVHEQHAAGATYRGKHRPGILISQCPDGSAWKIMGLTSLPTYGDGKPRTAYSDHEALGLANAGYYWGPRLPIVPIEDIHRRTGRITPTVCDELVYLCGRLTDREIADLRSSCRGAA